MKLLVKIIFLTYKLILIPILLNGQGLKITSGGYMIVNSGYVKLSQDLTNNGTYTDNHGTLIFSGITQSLEGTNATSLNNLKILTGSTTTLNTAGQTVKAVLTSDGTLKAGNKLTLLSTADQTALVSGAGSGSITGNLTMQRYLSSGFGYKYFCSPFQEATVNEFSDDMDLSAVFPTFYRYEENRDTAWWFDYTTTSNILSPMYGYAVNFGSSSDPRTVDITGVVSNGTMSVPLYNHNRTHTKGFTLVGNPYPSPIDWDASTGWTRTNIDNAIYYFDAGSSDQYVGSYSTYIDGVSSDGIASGIIPAMQGFFVHVTDGTFPVAGTLGFSNPIRINTLNPVFHKKSLREGVSLLRIAAGFETNSVLVDPLVIIFDPEALNTFNEKQDALKLMNTSPDIPSFYSMTGENKRYAIKALPVPTDTNMIIPLGITTLKQGNVSFTLLKEEQQISGLHIYLSDNKRSAIVALHPGMNYNVFVDEGVCNNRFSLILSWNEIQTNSGSDKELVAYYNNGKVFVFLNLVNGESAELMISDILGRVAYREKVSGLGYHAIDVDVKTGIYIASLRSDHAFRSKKIYIQGK
jgi:hypothetical protein